MAIGIGELTKNLEGEISCLLVFDLIKNRWVNPITVLDLYTTTVKNILAGFEKMSSTFPKKVVFSGFIIWGVKEI